MLGPPRMPMLDSGETLGILGGGQLGRMLALAGYPLGIRCHFFDPADAAPVAGLGPVVHAPYDDLEALGRWASAVDVVTYELEGIPAAAARRLQESVCLRPGARALEITSDRLEEKHLFGRLGIPTPSWKEASTVREAGAAMNALGAPVLLKRRRGGYDGRGQVLVVASAGLPAAWDSLGTTEVIVEKQVPFKRELSVIAARAADGEIRQYPLVENHHREGILRYSIAPAEASDRLQSQATDYMSRFLQHVQYVGTATIELFEVEGQLLANEIAPRVHNSGH